MNEVQNIINDRKIGSQSDRASATFKLLTVEDVNAAIASVKSVFHYFYGWKRPSFGVHEIYGLETIHFYTHLKTTTVRWF